MTWLGDGSTRESPIVRRSARLLVLDPDDRLLLFRIEDASLREPVLWITPGGGLEPGESYEQAARRELADLITRSPVAGGVFVPRRLAALLTPILTVDYPAEPIDTGI
ncbi:MAG: NUDIX domain-containing protein [Chloroflexota bacterium]|nr:NUDIX domain-containing protein [Chloroflexota bacterium]